jgi:CheY-like chemotaxis protein
LRFDRIHTLVVDDNPHMRRLIAEILRSLGVVHVHEAGDGAEALDVLRRENVDIIFTDLSMEPVDGVDFVRLLRNAPDSKAPMTPVIMITGHSTLAKVAEARDAGVNEFITKPITARAILQRIGLVIDHPRPYIRTDDYFGPDRRRKADPEYAGPMRRSTDIKPLARPSARPIADIKPLERPSPGGKTPDA